MTDQLKQLSEAATLANRLRGIYAIGPDVGGEPEFGHRDFGSAFTPRIQLEAAERIEALEAQLTEARAQVAVAYEVAAGICDREWAAEQNSIATRMFPIRANADWIADEIRTLTPDNTTTALEQIKQQAREPFKKLADDMADILNKMTSEHDPSVCYDMAVDALDLHTEQSAAILATLSADTQENSDG